jgi:Ca2+-binding EF-hand superfamily protein
VVERLLHTQEVAGSNPASRTIKPVNNMKLHFSGRDRFATASIVAIALTSCQTNKNLQPSNDAGTQVGGFELADANRDGKLSRDEASDFLVNEIFNSRDANHDGKLTKEEWIGADSARLAAFKKHDINHDGIVTKEEAIKYSRAHGIANKIMVEADKDHDGELSREEIQAYYASREGPPR